MNAEEKMLAKQIHIPARYGRRDDGVKVLCSKQLFSEDLWKVKYCQ